MNKREIVISTLKREPCGVVPYNIDFTIAMRESLTQHLGLASVEDLGRYVGNYCSQLNIGSVTGPSEGIIPEIYMKRFQDDLWRDDWGVIWRKGPGDDIGVVIDPPLKEPDLSGFTPAVPASRGKYLEKFCRENPDTFRIAAMSSPVFQRAWFLRGFENFLVDLGLNPEFVHDLLDVVMDYTLAVVHEALQYDIDALFFFDDYGQQSNLIISPTMWREFIKPKVKIVCDTVKAGGKFLFWHSCGDVDSIIPDLIEMGVEVLNPFQPEVMDVYEIKRQYGDRLSFYGGISTQELLPHGTVEEVKADVRKKMQTIGGDGGYILAPAHAVQADVPIENILALIEVASDQ